MVDTTDEWITTRTGIRERRIAAADDHGVDGVEQADREESQRHADKSDNGVYRAKARPSFGFLDPLAQHQVGKVDQFHDRHRCQPRVPGPPGVPDRARPDRAGDDRHQHEDQANLYPGQLNDIPLAVVRAQVDHTGYGGTDEAEHAGPGVGDVEVKHALHLAHGLLFGSVEKDHPGGEQEEPGRHPGATGRQPESSLLPAPVLPVQSLGSPRRYTVSTFTYIVMGDTEKAKKHFQ